MSKIFFIVGSGRSGTTAMVEVIGTAQNVRVYTEQSPKLCIAARTHYEGNLPYPKEFIYKSKKEKIEEVLKCEKVYGDKNLNYLYFIRELSEVWDCKFLFLIRDGRDVVRSCMDFHARRRPGYARYEDDEQSFLTQPEDDFWDYARIRPLKISRFYRNWKKMDQFEKFSWGWAEYNKILLGKIKNLDESRYKIIDMTNLKAEAVENIFNFLGLKGFNPAKVSHLLNSRINTTELETTQCFPNWKKWDSRLLNKFDKYTREMMEKLGYYQPFNASY